MSKHEPRNREEAFAYQLQDDVKLLVSLGALNDKMSYELHLQTIEMRIQTYRDLRGMIPQPDGFQKITVKKAEQGFQIVDGLLRYKALLKIYPDMSTQRMIELGWIKEVE